ncbi:helix-turn-helix domain-containing protein [Albimonas pacifica]|uniref:helix-turn-helix domain-containing protein n=1 Tax=Albimonas pacifica TaxID=1114924 RepID=UPI000B83A39C|nr:helix-turn-helix transcriptional regulator [Albimonas pacifica]
MKTRLREIREAKGISQRELARRLNTSNASISRLENEEASALIKLDRAARELGVTLYDLISDRPTIAADMERLFLALPVEQQRAVLDLARSLAAQQR